MNKDKDYINDREIVTPIEYLLDGIEELTPQGQEILREYYLGNIHPSNINNN